MGWIRRLFCKHEWKQLGDAVSVYESYFGEVQKIPSYHQQTYICRKCLAKKRIKF